MSKLLLILFLLQGLSSICIGQQGGLEVDLIQHHRDGGPAIVEVTPPYRNYSWEFRFLESSSWQTSRTFSVPYKAGRLSSCFEARLICCNIEIYTGCVGMEVCELDPADMVTVSAKPL